MGVFKEQEIEAIPHTRLPKLTMEDGKNAAQPHKSQFLQRLPGGKVRILVAFEKKNGLLNHVLYFLYIFTYLYLGLHCECLPVFTSFVAIQTRSKMSGASLSKLLCQILILSSLRKVKIS